MPNVRGRSNPVNPHDIPDTPAHGVETTTRRDLACSPTRERRRPAPTLIPR